MEDFGVVERAASRDADADGDTVEEEYDSVDDETE